MDAFNPRAATVTGVQGPDPDRARPRLPVAGPPAHAREGHDRDLQPLALRGRPGGAGARASCRRRSGGSATTTSTTGSGCSTDEGTTIIKFFLVIDRDEQKQAARGAPRRSRPRTGSSRLGDLAERELWDDYVAAFEECLERTSTEAAPWYLIPSNRNWFRNLAVSRIVAETLEALDPQCPHPNRARTWHRGSLRRRVVAASPVRTGGDRTNGPSTRPTVLSTVGDEWIRICPRPSAAHRRARSHRSS